MPILDLQKSLRLLGKIRMGETRKTATGKSFPSKLKHWRITSPSYELLEAASVIYGGDVRRWEGAPTEGEQFELYTTTDRLQVVVPADSALIQSYEMWSAGGCTRRCDGVTEELSGQRCICPADQEQRAAMASKGNACKMTTRLKVLLPDIPDIGVWMMESHGYYAAVELAGFEQIVAMAFAQQRMIPAQLRIDQRTVKRNGETRHFVVPALELVSVTAHQLASGQVSALGPGSGGALAAPLAAAGALPAGRVERAGPPALPGEDEIDGPPAPSNGDAAVTPPASAASPSPNRVAIAAREAGLDDAGRHLLAEWASLGRVTSSKLLTEAEQQYAIDGAKKIQAGRAVLTHNDQGALILRHTVFGWPIPPSDVAKPEPQDAGDNPEHEQTPSVTEIGAMKGRELHDALVAAGLDGSGKVDEMRERLMAHYGYDGSEPF